MMATVRYYAHDMAVREGAEYLQSFWELHYLIHKQRRTEVRWMYAKLAEERAEFIRQVRDNDKIGRRAYLPFRLRPDGGRTYYRFDSFEFNLKVADFDKRLADIRRAIPGGWDFHCVEVAQ